MRASKLLRNERKDIYNDISNVGKFKLLRVRTDVRFEIIVSNCVGKTFNILKKKETKSPTFMFGEA